MKHFSMEVYKYSVAQVQVQAYLKTTMFDQSASQNVKRQSDTSTIYIVIKIQYAFETPWRFTIKNVWLILLVELPTCDLH